MRLLAVSGSLRAASVNSALLRAVLLKLLDDRQLVATPAAVAHLARHLDRSMAKVLRAVAAIDRRVWQAKQAVTRDLVREVLAEVDGASREAD